MESDLRQWMTLCEAKPDLKFRQWFNGSEVTDWDGNPLVVYHGTDAKFDRFDPAYFGKRSGGVGGTGIKGYYFYGSVGADETGIAATSAKAWGKNVMHCYLRMINPFISDKLPDGVTEQKALDAGHDGIILRGGGLYVVFHPDQIWIIKD
jgi:hypothetical protein